MKDGGDITLVLLDLLLQVLQAPVAVIGQGNGAGYLTLNIGFQGLRWPWPICKTIEPISPVSYLVSKANRVAQPENLFPGAKSGS